MATIFPLNNTCMYLNLNLKTRVDAVFLELISWIKWQTVKELSLVFTQPSMTLHTRNR